MSEKFKNARLTIASISNTVYISEVSKKQPYRMTDVRKEVTRTEFISAFMEWYKNETIHIDEGGKKVERPSLIISLDGKPAYEIIVKKIKDEN